MRKKAIITAIMLLLVGNVLLLAGCSHSRSTEEIDARASEELGKIYNDELTVLRSRVSGGGVFGSGSNTELVLSTEKYPETISLTYSYNRITNSYDLLATNYNVVRYKDEILDRLKFINDIYPDCKYSVNCMQSVGGILKDCDFEEFIASQNSIKLYIFLPPAENKRSEEANYEMVDELRKTMKEHDSHVSAICMYYYDDDEKYNAIETDNLNVIDDVKEHYANHFSDVLNAGGYESKHYFIDKDYNFTNN